ncbi:MAG: hypothetical protein AAB662_00130 [Patescibacteria group bacterium]
MAGQPLERGALCSPDAAGRKRMGNFYLSNLLETATVREKRPSPFTAVELFVATNTGVSIPPILTNNFDLWSLDWALVNSYEDTLPLLLLGKYPNYKRREAPMRNNLDDAAVTLEIARQAKVIDGEIKISPSLIRIAGVIQGRVVAAAYDPMDNYRLTELNVSLPPRESLSMKNDDYLNSMLLGQFWITIPTDKDRPYDTAGLITQNMCDRAGTTNESLPEFSNKALTFQLHEKSSVMLGKAKNPQDTQGLNYAFKQMGYYIYRKDGFIKVALTDADAKRKHLQPWGISVPEFLQKA